MLLLLATLLALIASNSNVANAFVTQRHAGGRATRRAQALQPSMSANDKTPQINVNANIARLKAAAALLKAGKRRLVGSRPCLN